MNSNMKLIAHKLLSENGEIIYQSLKEHSDNVAELCSETCAQIGLKYTGYLVGKIHDIGKASDRNQEHIELSTPEKINHASAGMRWIWENCKDQGQVYTIMAQMISLVIGCHHSGRCDYISLDGSLPWFERMYSDQANKLYDECVENFINECCDEDELKELIRKSAEEINNLIHNGLEKTISKNADDKEKIDTFFFGLGLIQRFIFSALIDADWTDTACFVKQTGLLHIENEKSRESIWRKISENVESYVAHLPYRYDIDNVRKAISAQCHEAGKNMEPGIYRLYVPTGGGKTLSGLRFCVEMAKRHNAQHVFYFSPYKSITRQNAEVIRKAVGRDEYVLEHHSDVVIDNEDSEGNERWMSSSARWQGTPVICTTMVQMLNTLFAAPRQNVRRMSALAGSILLFDEIQALPRKDTCLLNMAVNVLAYVFGCTVIMCTATQPALDKTAYPVIFSRPTDIVKDTDGIFSAFKRTRIITDRLSLGEQTSEKISEFVTGLMDDNNNVLVILNTKKAVNRLVNCLSSRITGDVRLFCLTTNLCSRHRNEILENIRACLENHEKIICVSTQLTEAGVDISFECVVRSLAGLSSIAQAAGRCNRNGEKAIGYVYIIKDKDENQSNLPEINDGAKAAELTIIKTGDDDILSPKSISEYYQEYYYGEKQRIEMCYKLSSERTTMVELLSSNREAVTALSYTKEGSKLGDMFMRQAFGTAEAEFKAIEDETIPVVVPYKEGKTLIEKLYSDKDHIDLRELQPYVVSAGNSILEKLGNAVGTALDGAVYVLKEGFYDEIIGLNIDSNNSSGIFI